MTDILALLRTFSAIPCPPTLESAMHAALAEHLCDIADEMFSDSLGNFYAVLRGPVDGPVLMVECHIDEIGLMVSTIDNTGVLRFEKLGWIDDRTLPARLVDVHTASGPITGALSSGGADDRNQTIPYTRLYIDIAASSAAEAQQLGVRIGDTVTLRGPFEHLPGGLVTCRAVDNRAGVAVIIAALQELSRADGGRSGRPFTLVAAFASQHEVGLRGPEVTAYRAKPDACLVIDVSGNTAEVAQQAVRMGHGPVFRVMEEYGTNVAFGAQKGLFAHPALNSYVLELAERAAIPHQVQVRRGSIGDGVAIHTSRAGVPTASMLIPVRCSHTAHEICHPTDLELTRDLLVALLHDITAERIRSFGGTRYK